MAVSSFLKTEVISVTLIPFFDFPLSSGQPYRTVRTTPMLILLVEEVGEGAPAEKGATLPAATHSAWHTEHILTPCFLSSGDRCCRVSTMSSYTQLGMQLPVRLFHWWRWGERICLKNGVICTFTTRKQHVGKKFRLRFASLSSVK